MARLLFCAYIWYIWAERNHCIFRAQFTPASSAVHRILQTLHSRLLYLGISLPESISCHWNLYPESFIHTRLVPLTYQGWRLSISSTHHSSVGTLWKDDGQPLEGALHSAVDYYQGILQLMELIPNHLPSILIETDTSLARVLHFPHTSSWTMRFQVRSISAMLQNLHVTFVDLQPITVKFSNKLSRNRMIPSQISNLEICLLWRT